MSDFRLLMLSAMNENGGNTTHRLLDGHPELYTYPYESQPGTRFVSDHLSPSLYPSKYRWPVFPMGASAAQCYQLIIDEETKIRIRTPHTSKFRIAPFEVTEADRRAHFLEAAGSEASRARMMEAFFRSTFSAWKDLKRSGQERTYVGYSPIIAVDARAIIDDYAGRGFVLHVLRNPFSAYADTKKRPVPQSVAHYVTGWLTCLAEARYTSKLHPEHCFILRYEDIIVDPVGVLGGLLAKLGHTSSPTLAAPSWNGEPLKEIYPWGTIRVPTPEVNLATARELTAEEIAEIHLRTLPHLEEWNYLPIYQQLV